MKSRFNPSKLFSIINRTDEPDEAAESNITSDELSEEEVEEYRAILDTQMQESAQTVLEEMEQRDSIKLPSGIKRIFSIALLLTTAILGLFIVSQVASFANDIKALPAVWRWLATICVIIFSLVIIHVMILLIWKFFRLQRNQQVNPEALKALSERRHLQLVADEKKEQALELLCGYLRKYPVDERNKRRLIKLGFKSEEWLSLIATREKLLAEASSDNIEGWLDDLKNGFQKLLDAFARRRIRQYALKVGSGTALSPISIVDQMIVLYGCTGLIREMLLIYNLRPAWGQSLAILSRGIIHTYLSGVIEGAAENIVDSGADTISDFMGDSFNFLTGTIGKAVGSRTAEATLNGVLIWRLGKSIMTQLQPVR